MFNFTNLAEQEPLLKNAATSTAEPSAARQFAEYFERGCQARLAAEESRRLVIAAEFRRPIAYIVAGDVPSFATRPAEAIEGPEIEGPEIEGPEGDPDAHRN